MTILLSIEYFIELAGQLIEGEQAVSMFNLQGRFMVVCVRET